MFSDSWKNFKRVYSLKQINFITGIPLQRRAEAIAPVVSPLIRPCLCIFSHSETSMARSFLSATAGISLLHISWCVLLRNLGGVWRWQFLWTHVWGDESDSSIICKATTVTHTKRIHRNLLCKETSFVCYTSSILRKSRHMRQKKKLRTVAKLKTQDYKNWRLVWLAKVPSLYRFAVSQHHQL